MTRPGTTRSPRRAGPPAATPPPGPSTTPRKPRKATSTPPATTGSRSSARSPPTRACCAAHILSFRPLPGDLARAAATPAFSFIAPDLCNDGHDAPCVTGAPGGLADLTDPAERFVVGTRISGRLGWTHPDIAGFLTGAGLDALDIPGGLASRALRDIQAGQAKGRFTVPDPEIALSAVADGLLGLLRMCQRHPERVTETTVDQLAEAELRLLGVPAGEAARLTALPLPPNEAW